MAAAHFGWFDTTTFAGGLVDPPERRHVGRGSVQDAALTDAGLRRPAGLPADETWLPSRIQRCRLGTSPDRSARRSTAWATPSSWMNTMPGDIGDGRRPSTADGLPRHRWSSHASSSMASNALTSVVTMTRPITMTNAVQKPVDLDTRQQVEHTRTNTRVEDDRTEAERQDGRAARGGTPAPARSRRCRRRPRSRPAARPRTSRSRTPAGSRRAATGRSR